jgi:hypothetical protein
VDAVTPLSSRIEGCKGSGTVVIIVVGVVIDDDVIVVVVVIIVVIVGVVLVHAVEKLLELLESVLHLITSRFS